MIPFERKEIRQRNLPVFANTDIKVMSAGDSNPAATPTPCEDIQGDGRWMSLVCVNYYLGIYMINIINTCIGSYCYDVKSKTLVSSSETTIYQDQYLSCIMFTFHIHITSFTDLFIFCLWISLP